MGKKEAAFLGSECAAFTLSTPDHPKAEFCSGNKSNVSPSPYPGLSGPSLSLTEKNFWRRQAVKQNQVLFGDTEEEGEDKEERVMLP